MKNQSGFTLIELLTVITIFGIMAAVAIPSYSAMVLSGRQSSAYNTLAGTISLARMEAVKASRVVSMCISSDQDTCDATTATEWNNGWIVFSDFDGDGLVDAADGDTILARERAQDLGIRINSTDFGSLISMAPRGRLRTQGTFVVCNDDLEDEEAMALNLWVTGLGRQATDSAADNDEIVEDLTGNNISCS